VGYGSQLRSHTFIAVAEVEQDLSRVHTMVELRTAREHGSVGRKPRAQSEEDQPQVQALMRQPDVVSWKTCERIYISGATLDCHVRLNGRRRQ